METTFLRQICMVRHWLFQMDTTVLGDSNSTTMLDPEEPFL